MTTAERVPCPQCSLGVYAWNLRRHVGSKVCQQVQKRNEFTRSLFAPANELLGIAARIKQLAEEIRK